MSELAINPSKSESLRSRELSESRKKEIGTPAVEAVVESSEKIVRAKRLQNLGKRITEAAQLRVHRKEIRHKKLYGEKTYSEFNPKMPGLRGSLEKRKMAVKKAKKDVKFAEKGYGKRARRVEIKQEKNTAQTQLHEERGGIPKGLGGTIERYGIRREAKARAEAAVSAREKAAASELELRQAELKKSRSRRDQTSSAYQMTKLHASGGKTNIISTFSEVPKTTEDRLAALQARGRVNVISGSAAQEATSGVNEAAELSINSDDIANLHSLLLLKEQEAHSGPEPGTNATWAAPDAGGRVDGPIPEKIGKSNIIIPDEDTKAA